MYQEKPQSHRGKGHVQHAMDALDEKEITEGSLVIIGNGFDLAHNLKTSFSDFRTWLLEHGQKDFVHAMENVFYRLRGLDESKLWSEFELALGDVDVDLIHSLYQEGHKGKDVFDDVIEPTVLSIRKNFTNWINDIDTHLLRPKFSLPKSVYYLSFNYTDTLETVYKIPESNIRHIHGSSRTGGNTLIYGCQDDPIPLTVLDKEEDDDLQYLVRYKTAELLNNGLKKNTNEIITNNRDFFARLSNTKKVFVIGHSLAEVDWPYFNEIRKYIAKDAKWQISYHSMIEKIRFQSSSLFIGRQNVQFKRF